jgi:beta-lactamase class A
MRPKLRIWMNEPSTPLKPQSNNGVERMSLRDQLLACITDNQVEFGIAVEHIESGEKACVNADAIFPTASVFKVPVMVEVFEQARAGRFGLDDRLALETRHRTLTTGVLLQLQDGLRPTIRDLVTLMIIVSDNVATTMLMELVGPEKVTATMHGLGLTSIHVNMTVHEMFLHAFGIPDRAAITIEELREVARNVQMDYTSRAFSRGPDNAVASAADMTQLMAMIYKGEVIDRAACDEMLDILSHQQYNGRVPRYLPWYTVYHKTGTMRGLRNDSGIIYCNQDSHAAFTIFSFDDAALPLSDCRHGVSRSLLVEQMMGEMGLAIYNHHIDGTRT